MPKEKKDWKQEGKTKPDWQFKRKEYRNILIKYEERKTRVNPAKKGMQGICQKK